METTVHQRHTTHGQVLNAEKTRPNKHHQPSLVTSINVLHIFITQTDGLKSISFTKGSDSFFPPLFLIWIGCSIARSTHENLQAMTVLQRRESLQPSFLCCQLFLLTSLPPAVFWAIFWSLHLFASYDISGWFN